MKSPIVIFSFFFLSSIRSQVINCCTVSVHFGGDVFQMVLINNLYQKVQSKYLKLQHSLFDNKVQIQLKGS